MGAAITIPTADEAKPERRHHLRWASPSLPRLLYFGEVPVESSYHGSALLYRLLRSYPGDKLQIFERRGRASASARRLPGVLYQSVPSSWSLGARFLRTRLPFLFWPIWTILARRWANRACKRLNGFEPEAVLSVHEGSLWLGAHFLAKRLRVPLHLVIHDEWFREMPMGGWLRQRLEDRFGRIYRSAASRFCVSPYMERLFHQRYGTSGDILYPSRSSDMKAYAAPPNRSGAEQRAFTIAYGGSTLDGGYLEALKSMARVLDSRGARLLLFGPFSSDDVSRSGLNFPNVTCCGLVTSTDLIARFREDADALFVPMSFAEKDRVNMTVSFPSKLADYTAVGLPLIIHGPPYCSAVQWARENHGCCAVVDQVDPVLLGSAVDRLRCDANYCSKLAAGALRAGNKYFSHDAAQSLFFRRISNSLAEKREPAGAHE